MNGWAKLAVGAFGVLCAYNFGRRGLTGQIDWDAVGVLKATAQSMADATGDSVAIIWKAGKLVIAGPLDLLSDANVFDVIIPTGDLGA
jgi:hypothetical protein